MTASNGPSGRDAGRPRSHKHAETRRRTRRLAPEVLGICLIMILGSSLTLIASPAKAGEVGPHLLPGDYVTFACSHGAISLSGTSVCHDGIVTNYPLCYTGTCQETVRATMDSGYSFINWAASGNSCLGISPSCGTSSTSNPSNYYGTGGSGHYTGTLTLNGQQVPFALTFSPSASYGYPPLSVTLNANTTGGSSPFTAGWIFGDWTSASQTNPNSSGGGSQQWADFVYGHVYQRVGSFVASVNISDGVGQRVTASATIIVGLVPSVFYSFYNETHLIGNGTTGSTYAIGLVEECNESISDSVYQNDLNNFDLKFGLSATTLTFVGPGASSCSSTAALFWKPIETSLDIEWAHVAAPGAKIYVCLDNQVTVGGLEACNHLFYQKRNSSQYNTMIVSNSWGWCATGAAATGPGPANQSCTNGQDPYALNWSAAQLAGMNLFASTGDFTPDSCSRANYDSSNPYGIAVGGTTITAVESAGSYGSERVWVGQKDPSSQCSLWVQNKLQDYFGNWGETYGTSSYYKAPSWQSSLLGNSNRSFPDVSMDADNSTGVPVLSQGVWHIAGGTSVGSPIWAGILDVLFQAGALSLGTFAAPFLYSYPSCFHNLTNPATGARDGLGTPNVGCLAAD